MQTTSRESDAYRPRFARIRLAAAVQAVLLGGAIGIAAGAAHAAPAVSWKEGQILVKPKAGLSASDFDGILRRSNAQSRGTIEDLPVHIVSVPPQAEEAVARALAKNPQIEFAELDMAVAPTTTTPNDASYASQWHLGKIQAPTAWDTSKADNIVIAVLDTGVDASHPDLAAKILPGYNAVDGSGATADINGHGTAVAGTAAAVTNNATGVAGVAWNAMILPVRVSNSSDGYAYWSDVARGLQWAANQGADVANISYEDLSNSSTISNAAQYMRSKNGLVVVAAGNSGVDLGYADNPYLICVSATVKDDTKASWSNYGAYIDVAAPGDYILTTVRGGGYANWRGTSFSSPVAAGVVAEIMGANPKLSADQVEKILENSADKITGSFHPYYGYGRVNTAAAVSLALNSAAADTAAPSVNIFSPGAGASVSGLVQVDVSASDNVAVTGVSLYANGKLVGTDGTAPYQFSWDSKSVADGSVTLNATAVDGAGNQGTSSNVGVTVKNQATTDTLAPSVTISKPVDGSKVTGTVSVGVSAQDDVSVANVKLYLDGKQVSSATGATLSYSWNTRKASTGAHTLAAVATDTSGKATTKTIQVYK